MADVALVKWLILTSISIEIACVTQPKHNENVLDEQSYLNNLNHCIAKAMYGLRVGK